MRAAVVLAAGKGTRMRSGRAKVLHRLAGLSLVEWVVRAVTPLVERTVVVVGHERDAVQEQLSGLGLRFAVQEPQEGTGHALACAAPELDGADEIIVLLGDAPFVRTESLAALSEQRRRSKAAATVMTFRAADPTGYGRIVREGGEDADAGSPVEAIVEEVDASEQEKRLDEVNSGAYVLEAAAVLPLLGELPRSAKGERYLTDVVKLLRAEGRSVSALAVPEVEALGINSQSQLSAAEATWRARRIEELLDAGVSIVDPSAVSLHAEVEVRSETVLEPFVALEGATRIAEGCRVGPLVRLRDVTLGAGCVVRGPLALERRELSPGSVVGPEAGSGRSS